MPDATSHAAVYLRWLGKRVTLRLAVGTVQTVLHCTLLGESDTSIRIRLHGVSIPQVWEVDIYKDMILGVGPV